MLGSFKISLFAMLLSKDKRRDGSNNKFANIANNKVMETNPPKATVPPKLEIIKTEKPKNKTIEV